MKFWSQGFLSLLNITLRSTAYMLMKIPADPMSFIGRSETEKDLMVNAKSDVHKEEDKVKYLDTQTRYLDPTFLLAWWDLREHIENYELTYFFEVYCLETVPKTLINNVCQYTADKSHYIVGDHVRSRNVHLVDCDVFPTGLRTGFKYLLDGSVGEEQCITHFDGICGHYICGDVVSFVLSDETIYRPNWARTVVRWHDAETGMYVLYAFNSILTICCMIFVVIHILYSRSHSFLREWWQEKGGNEREIGFIDDDEGWTESNQDFSQIDGSHWIESVSDPGHYVDRGCAYWFSHIVLNAKILEKQRQWLSDNLMKNITDCAILYRCSLSESFCVWITINFQYHWKLAFNWLLYVLCECVAFWCIYTLVDVVIVMYFLIMQSTEPQTLFDV